MAHCRCRIAVLVATCVLHLTAGGVWADPFSAKRGFADTGVYYDILQAVNAGWYYRWGPDRPAGAGDFDAEFVPMIWGGWQANTTTINSIIADGNIEWVLGFNEPERDDQADMTVAQAISAWQTLDAGFDGTGIKLVSPGVADTGGSEGGQAWLANFMSQADTLGLQVDAVAFHWYGVSTPNDPVGAASSFLSRVDSYHNSYGLPVWITEFGIIDWGGSYTTEEMRAANATFLEHVIPGLESRSYVEGYAFYNWTGDTTLVEGSPLTPTNVGVPYVGTLESGDAYDFSSIDVGDHVAYLAGGELTYSGGAGGVQHINALARTSHLTGSANWGMVYEDWVRVQSGATLRKGDTNTVTLDGTTVTNNGVIDVAEGELSLDARYLDGAGKIRVRSGATLRLDGTIVARPSPGTFFHHIELDGGTVVAPAVQGYVGVAADSVLSGDGVVSGNVTAYSASTLRVGDTGLSSSSWLTIDDFESYAAGKLNAGATGGVWTGVFDGTANAQVVDDAGNNSLEYYGTGSAWRGAQTSLQDSFSPENYALADGETATYFFRVQRQGTETIDGIFGLTDLERIGTNAPWNELATTLSLFQGTGTSDTTALRAYDGDGGGDIVILDDIGAGEWINVWLVVDNDNKTYEVATSTGTDDGALFARTFEFGRQGAAGSSLVTFAGAEYRSGSNTANASVRIDDLVYLIGENLTNPLGGATPGLFVDPAVLRVEGNFTMLAGSTLEIDLFDPTAFDLLEVTGVLTAAGSLEVGLDAQAPDLEAGDVFDVLDFASLTGTFGDVVLPTLTSGLTWDLSQLYTDGVLAVVATGLTGDYNDDGVVDAADYTVWRDSFGQSGSDLPADGDGNGTVDEADYVVWKSHYGDTAGSGSTTGGAALAAVPEPASLVMLILGLLTIRFIRRTSPA